MKLYRQAKKYGPAVVIGGLATNAMATLPTGVDTAFTSIGTDITTLAGYAATAVMLSIGFVIALKLTKRFANKV